MRRKQLIIVLIVLFIIAAVYAYVVFSGKSLTLQKPLTQRSADSLGYRQNNPGDLRAGGDVFDGEVTSSTGFKAFDSMAYGYRAVAILLLNYFKAGKTTIRDMISTYAPGSENNTAKYIADVSSDTGIGPDKALSLADFRPGLLGEAKVKKIIRSISEQEIGYVNESELTKGYNLFVADRL